MLYAGFWVLGAVYCVLYHMCCWAVCYVLCFERSVLSAACSVLVAGCVLCCRELYAVSWALYAGCSPYAGGWMLCAGSCVLGAVCRVLCTGCCVPFTILSAGHCDLYSMLEAGCLVLCAGCRVLYGVWWVLAAGALHGR